MPLIISSTNSNGAHAFKMLFYYFELNNEDNLKECISTSQSVYCLCALLLYKCCKYIMYVQLKSVHLVCFSKQCMLTWFIPDPFTGHKSFNHAKSNWNIFGFTHTHKWYGHGFYWNIIDIYEVDKILNRSKCFSTQPCPTNKMLLNHLKLI